MSLTDSGTAIANTTNDTIKGTTTITSNADSPNMINIKFDSPLVFKGFSTWTAGYGSIKYGSIDSNGKVTFNKEQFYFAAYTEMSIVGDKMRFFFTAGGNTHGTRYNIIGNK